MHPEFNPSTSSGSSRAKSSDDSPFAHEWDVRHIIRLIVTSDTYQQSSFAEANEKDLENRLLAHQNRFRIDAENVRDVILRVSGLLSDTFGGPSVSPIEPSGYLAALNFPKREYSAITATTCTARRLHDLAAYVLASAC